MASKELTCGVCKYLAFGHVVRLRTAYCTFGRSDDDGPIVPHKSQLIGDKTLITLWRVPLECQRSDLEVAKSDGQVDRSEWTEIII